MSIGSSKCIDICYREYVIERAFPLKIKENSWSTSIRTLIISISIVPSLVIRMIDYQEYLN